jgi:cell division protein FtsA
MIDDADSFATETKYSVVTSTPVFFILDDNKHYIDVIGSKTTKMRGKVSFVLARKSFIMNTIKVMKKLGIEVKAFIPEMLAESLFIVPTQERDNSAVLLNIGYFETNVTVVYGDAIVYNKTIGVGGMQIANDLALVMNIDVDLAEQIKKRYSFGLGTGGEKLFDFAKNSEGKMEKFNHGLVSEIIDARVEHLCRLINNAFETSPITIARRTRIFLSGGGLAMMRGSRDMLQKYLKRQVRLTNIEAPQLATPNYYAVLGLLDYVFETDYYSEGNSGKTLIERISSKMYS